MNVTKATSDEELAMRRRTIRGHIMLNLARAQQTATKTTLQTPISGAFSSSTFPLFFLFFVYVIKWVRTRRPLRIRNMNINYCWHFCSASFYDCRTLFNWNSSIFNVTSLLDLLFGFIVFSVSTVECYSNFWYFSLQQIYIKGRTVCVLLCLHIEVLPIAAAIFAFDFTPTSIWPSPLNSTLGPCSMQLFRMTRPCGALAFLFSFFGNGHQGTCIINLL